LEGDQALTLLVQAAVEGVIDFREARLNDRYWWKRVNVLLKGLERRNRFLSYDAMFRMHLALVANSGLTEESFDKEKQIVQELYYDVIGQLRPWEGVSWKERKKAEVKSLRQQYIDNFGVDPADPAFKEWEAKQIAAMLAGDDDEETDEQRVTRLLHERLKRQGG
jgi:hypothetical protein